MTDPTRLRADPLSALLGLVGVAGHVAGVLFLGDVTGAYKPDQLDRWAALSALHPQATVASAVSFIVGLLALVGWAAGLAGRVPSQAARFGAGAIALGALLNAAGWCRSRWPASRSRWRRPTSSPWPDRSGWPSSAGAASGCGAARTVP